VFDCPFAVHLGSRVEVGALENRAVSTHSIRGASGEDILSGGFHDAVLNRKSVTSKHLQVEAKRARNTCSKY
jgi:hypothetical protein